MREIRRLFVEIGVDLCIAAMFAVPACSAARALGHPLSTWGIWCAAVAVQQVRPLLARRP